MSGILTVESFTVCGAGTDAAGDLAGKTAAVQSAFWRFFESLHLTVAGVGRGELEADGSDARHGHDGAFLVWVANGQAGKLQPEEQRQAKLSADTDLRGRDTGVRCGGLRKGDQ